MNEVCLGMPLTNIALSHDTVEKNTYISIHRIPFLQLVWNVSICLVYPIITIRCILISLHSFGRQNSFKF